MVTIINELKENEVFVFGSNMNGHHSGGAAKLAFEKFGAIEGSWHGIQGIGHDFRSFAIPTLGFNYEKLPLKTIRQYIDELVDVAKLCPEKTFLLTPIGTGIAGFSLEEIKSILPKKIPKNIIKVGEWK